jgi:hypothetical protein
MKEVAIKKFKLCFDEKNGGILKIENGNKSIAFSELGWMVELADKTQVTKKCGLVFSYEHSDVLSLNWKNEDISVAVTIFSEDGMLKSKIKVDSDAQPITRVNYPLYVGVKQLDGDRLLLPWQNGLIVKDPIKNLIAPEKKIRFWMGRGDGKYENDYPAQFSYQFFAYYSNSGEGYYMSCDDGNAYIKTMGVYNSNEEGRLDFRFINYPENMGKVYSYEIPYNYCFSFIDEGWKSAAKTYRSWAVNQKWYVPLDKRSISKQIDELNFVRINHEHYRLGTDDKEYYQTSKMIKERLECKPLMHWYGWNKAPKHGDWYPEMADWSDPVWYSGLKNRNSQLDGIGVKKIPYVNVHLWDKKLKSFDEENAENYLIMGENLKIADEPWIPEGTLYAVCHSTEKIKEKAKKLFSRLVTRDGFDGIYIDQVASFNATLCFNAEHGHPVGGGRWWADEYHDMIGSFRKSMPEDKILTTESCCECYHDLFDMFLILDTTLPFGFSNVCGTENADSIPLFAMIYGDSAVAYGSVCKFENNDDQFEFNYMRNILFGMIPTAEGIEAIHADDTKKWEILKRGVDFFKQNREVLIYGILDDYITFGERTVPFNNAEKKCPEVICAKYKYKNLDYVYAYNYTDSKKHITPFGKSLCIEPNSFARIQFI